MRTYINRADINKGLCDPTNKLLRFFSLFLFLFRERERERGEGERFGREAEEKWEGEKKSKLTQKHRKAFFGFV